MSRVSVSDESSNVSPALNITDSDTRQAAIVRGAALRGLTGMAPRKRRCRRHYGIQLRDGFREGIDPEDWAVFDPYDGRKLCKHRMIWLFSKVSESAPYTYLV